MSAPTVERRPTAAVPSWVAVGGLLLGTILTYLAFFAWDQSKDVDPVTHQETGPYEAWQVVGVVIVLGVLAAAAGWLGRPAIAVLVVPLTFTVCWSIDAAMVGLDAADAALWPIGALSLVAGSLAGVALAAVGAFALRQCLWRR